MTSRRQRNDGKTLAEFLDAIRESGVQADAYWHERGPLGQQLLLARTRAQLTQTALADASGVRQSDISEIERGGGNPTRSTLEKLGVALEIDFSIGASSAA